MTVRKTDEFIADVELQYQWYAKRAGRDVAKRYLMAVEITCGLVGRQHRLGPEIGSKNPRLLGWRFFVVVRPFHRHVLFYEIQESTLLLRRSLHGHRDLPRRLLEPPGAE